MSAAESPRPAGFEIRWRAEGSRDLARLRSRGYEKQALIPILKTKYNLGAAWHPFSKPENSSRFWYRKLNGDNDWYTVISVATDWKVALCFPKIEQTPRLQFWRPGQVLNSIQQMRNPDLVGLVEFADGAKGYRMVTRSNVAMLLVERVIFDTRARQSKDPGATGFPEQGVSEIPGQNVMGVVEYIRVHHGGADDDGFSAVMDIARQVFNRFKTEPGVTTNLLRVLGTQQAADEFALRMKNAWSDASKSQQVNAKWTADGFSQINDPARTRQIKHMMGTNNQRIY